MLSTEEIKQLLVVAMGYDNRRPGELNVAAWREAADRGKWRFDEAVEAMHTYYYQNKDFVAPADITKGIRVAHRAIAEAEHAMRLKAIPQGVQRSFRELWLEAIVASKAGSRERRDLILSYPDLFERMLVDPIGMADPRQWNGWIPPEVDAYGRRNTTTRRDALLDLEDEARRRAQGDVA